MKVQLSQRPKLPILILLTQDNAEQKQSIVLPVYIGVTEKMQGTETNCVDS
jgi:hypothetical protein